MSKKCQVTGKKPLTGNNVSHANNKTKRRQLPNLQKKKLLNPATGRTETILISARGLRTLAKWLKEGKKFDLKKLTNK
ncbi:50S ribosomal protein L28 [Candidatus Parcubacteria bacterium]|nr:MAG: 50S ribosomal protein L28 [Candidatus Parcubacteria bacterium]